MHFYQTYLEKKLVLNKSIENEIKNFKDLFQNGMVSAIINNASTEIKRIKKKKVNQQVFFISVHSKLP